MEELPDIARKGRGAVSNRSGRFEAERRSKTDDGWWQDPDLPPLRTELFVDTAKSVISRNDSPDVPFDRSINPYRGCEHGCVYCYARPSHSFLGLSPGLDFETKLYYKPDAAKRLIEELRRPGYRVQPIALGTNTDPYQPVERGKLVMREILEVLRDCRHPVTITTKSALILRDIDILADLARDNLLDVGITLVTLDPELARNLEPRASRPANRLEAMRRLAEAGVRVNLMLAPVIPALTDPEMEKIIAAAAESGAAGAVWTLLRLPSEVENLFEEWLAAHAPGRAAHVMTLMRQCHGGKPQDSRFHRRMSGEGPYAEMLEKRFQLAIRKLGLGLRSHRLDCSRFTAPARAGDQLSLALR